jgi:hypothetical protein
METIAHCEACDKSLHEGDHYLFDTTGLVYVCSTCVEEEQDRLQEEFGWIGVGRGDSAGKGVPATQAPTCEHKS